MRRPKLSRSRTPLIVYLLALLLGGLVLPQIEPLYAQTAPFPAEPSFRNTTASDWPLSDSATLTINNDSMVDGSTEAHVNVTVPNMPNVPNVLDIGATTVITWTEDSPPQSIDPNLTINAATTLNAARVTLNAGYQPGVDRLSIGSSTATSGTVNTLNWVWDAVQGELRLSGDGDDAGYQAALRQVTFSSTGDNPVSVQRSVRFSLGSGLQYAGNGHFYEFVPTVVDWDVARSQAASKSYFGLQGYLVTVTEAGETNFIRTKLDDRGGWIGASDAATPNDWRWVTGPEGMEDGGKGQLFWRGTASGTAIPNNGYTNWNPGEPNDSGDVAYFIRKACTFTGCQWGKWDDVPNASLASVNGYVVEYGGLPNDPVVTLAGDVTVNVTPVNDSPTEIALSKSNVDENLPSTTVVGSFSAVDPDSGPPFSYALVNGPGAEDNSGFTIDGNQLKTSNAFDYETKNSYTIRVRVLDSNGGSFEKIFLITINDKDVTPTFVPPIAPLPVRYGSDFHYAAAANGEPFTMTYSATGLPAGLSINPATGEISGKPTQVGTFPVAITASNGASNPGPATGNVNISIEVQKASLTAKAVDQAIKVGNPVPLQILYSGFVLGDDVGDLDQSGQLTYPGAPAFPVVGQYTFTFATLPADSNYDIVLQSGTLDVVSKDVPSITWPTPADIIYGTPLSGAQLNATSSVSGTFVYSPSAATRLDAGAGRLLQAVFTPADSVNFAPVLVSNQITITKAPLVITADDKTGYVNDPALPIFTVTYSGFIKKDSPKKLDQPVQFSTSAKGTNLKGKFIIQPFGAQDANYAITFVPGKLTLILPPAAPHYTSPAPTSGEYQLPYHHVFLATGNPLAMTYQVTSGALPPGLTLNGDSGLLEGTPTQSGVYTFTVQAANGVAPAAIQNVTLVIAKAMLMIQAEDRTVFQGSPLPSFSALYQGFRGSDTKSVLNTDVTLVVTVTDTSTLGYFDIMQSSGSPAVDDNYDIVFQKGQLHVTDKQIPVITWANPAAINYSTALGVTQLNATANVSGTFTYAPAAGTILPAGKGELLAVTFTPADLVTYVPVNKTVQIDVNPKSLTITAEDKTMSAGGSLPELTATFNSFITGEDATDLESPVRLKTSAITTQAGTYPIVASGAKSKNYTITHVNGTLTVQAVCTLDGLSSGAAGSTFPYTAHGFAAGEQVTITVDGTTVGTAQADAFGVIRAAVYLDPSVSAGDHTIANTAGPRSTSCQVTISANHPVQPNPGDRTTLIGRLAGPGSTLPLVVAGCQPGEDVSIKVNGRLVDVLAADANGKLDAKIVIDPDLVAGPLDVQAICQGRTKQLQVTVDPNAPKQDAPGSGILIDPQPTQPGGYIPFTPCGFQPDAVVDVLVDGQMVGTATAGGDGCLNTIVQFDPNTQPGVHTIQAGPVKEQVMIAVVGVKRPNPGNAPVLTNSNVVGAPGSFFPVTGTGFQPGERVDVIVAGKKIGEVTAKPDGTVDLLLQPNPDVAAGTLPVTLLGQNSGATTEQQITVDPNGPQLHNNGGIPVITQLTSLYLPTMHKS